MLGGGSTIDFTATPPTGKFQNLYSNYYTSSTATGTNSLQYNLSLPLSGSFDGSSVSGKGNTGYWWSSTRNTTNAMYDFFVNTSDVYTSGYFFRNSGYSLRCVAQ
ncbi:hypothetical protein IKF21_03050 [Candidatus Saccharibacteria bacterium]|nr:hypothetical protein [Candidatus Saccharibacteria bacterium]